MESDAEQFIERLRSGCDEFANLGDFRLFGNSRGQTSVRLSTSPHQEAIFKEHPETFYDQIKEYLF